MIPLALGSVIHPLFPLKNTSTINTNHLTGVAIFGNVMVIMLRHYGSNFRRAISDTVTPCFLQPSNARSRPITFTVASLIVTFLKFLGTFPADKIIKGLVPINFETWLVRRKVGDVPCC